MSKANKSHRSN